MFLLRNDCLLLEDFLSTVLLFIILKSWFQIHVSNIGVLGLVLWFFVCLGFGGLFCLVGFGVAFFFVGVGEILIGVKAQIQLSIMSRQPQRPKSWQNLENE